MYSYRYHDQWKFATQRLVFVVSLVEFLTEGRLLLWQEAATRLHLTAERSQSRSADGDKTEVKSAALYLDLEDYLHGIISLSNELVNIHST